MTLPEIQAGPVQKLISFPGYAAIPGEQFSVLTFHAIPVCRRKSNIQSHKTMKSLCQIFIWLMLATIGARLSSVRAQNSTNWNTLTNWIPTGAPSEEMAIHHLFVGWKPKLAVKRRFITGGFTSQPMRGLAGPKPRLPLRRIGFSIASSSDGIKLAAVNVDGTIYTSTNSGATWTPTSAPAQPWFSIASSSDGTRLAALALGSGIFTSTNGGANWTPTSAPNGGWQSIASSADGTKLAAVMYPGNIYTSTNSGATWTPTSAPNVGWNSIASSSDGTKLAAVVDIGGIYTSTNGGVTWTPTSAPGEGWNSIAFSSDGTKLAAVYGNGGAIYISTNGGVIWTKTGATNQNWFSIASSSDGTRLVAAVYAGGIYSAQAAIHTPPAPLLGIVATNNLLLLHWPNNNGGANGGLQSIDGFGASNWMAATDTLTAAYGSYTAVSVSNSMSARYFRLTLVPPTSDGMVFVPAGSFTMGDTLDGELDAIPAKIYVSAFYMDTNLVSYSQWQNVYAYATSQGYSFNHVGAGKAANHPVLSIDWFDAVKWCNARSQQGGLTPVYYTDAGLTQIYMNDEVAPFVNWKANGYRLPTEAEWEKAARGGLAGQRFPWGNTISENQANYKGDTNDYNYDLGPNGYNASFTNGVFPYTSPVGYFAANGYGLYDMAGNVEEWCWDWWGKPYGQPTTTDPIGPASGGLRIMRGGYWYVTADYSRCAYRYDYIPGSGFEYFGFRCVRKN